MKAGMCTPTSITLAQSIALRLANMKLGGLLIPSLYDTSFLFYFRYRQIPAPEPKGDEGSTHGPVEMVTVPTLGPEWQKSELRNMTKAAKREKKAEMIKRKWTGWKRDEEGLCGGWLTRRRLIFVLFALCVAWVISQHLPGQSLI
jgi:hypothetical protein